MRITVDDKRSETTSGRECYPTQWNSKAGRLKGNKEDVKTFNAFLDNLQSKVYDAHKILSELGVDITADSFCYMLIHCLLEGYFIIAHSICYKYKNQSRLLFNTRPAHP